jgi:DNA polymerase epsilon subunit 1
LKILSYDIETSKEPLKFPDVEKNEVMMISLMYEGEAFLIVNMGFCGNEVK